jgi:hypothetical protein
MPPKTKAASAKPQPRGKVQAPVGAKIQTKARRRTQDACIDIIAAVFPDFVEDSTFCAELADKVLECIVDAAGPSAYANALDDALLGMPDPSVVLSDLHSRLIDAGLVKVQNACVVEEEDEV